MREPRILFKKNLADWVARLALGAEVIAPCRRPGPDVLLSTIRSAEEVAWDYLLPTLPPKSLLFPQTECLFSFRADGQFEVKPHYDQKKRVLLGLRSCDVSGIRLMDRFFMEPLLDHYYQARRQNTLLISQSCQSPGDACFCVCADGGPFLKDGYDLQLTDLGDRYLVEVGTEQGGMLIKDNEVLFDPATPGEVEERVRIDAQTEKKFKPLATAYFTAATRKLSIGQIPDGLWRTISARCVACGGCSFVCPTCTCFNVFDRIRGQTGLRCRNWDSCEYAGFTREASTHNPRADQAERRKRRFFHKLSYQYVQRDGMQGCVGCGRCILSCPSARIDMPSVVEAIRRGEIE